MKKLLIIAGIVFTTLSVIPAHAQQFIFDKSSTNILFSIRYPGFSDMVGQFKDFDGNFSFDEKKPETSSVNIIIRPRGIKTSNPDLDKELQDKHWFDTKHFPEMKFVNTSIKLTGSNTADVTGNLTLLGVTKPVTLHVKFNKTSFHALTKEYLAGFQADGVIKRSDFGMDHMVPFISDEVRLQIYAQGEDKHK